MKIEKIENGRIIFDNGNTISYDHDQDCCEQNYADFEQLDDLGRAYDFDESTMQFEFVEDAGFRFGDARQMFFVPCYSDQNGYYTTQIDIYYNCEMVCSGSAEFVDC